MDGLDSKRPGGFNIGKRVINEQTFPGCAMNFLQRELENGWVWLDKFVFTGDDQVVEYIQKTISMPDELKFFHRKIAQEIQRPACSLQLPCDLDGLFIRAGNAVHPIRVVCLDQIRIVGESA